MPGCLGFRELGLQPYEPVLEAMRRFTGQRTAQTPDEVWLVEHLPVFTQGQAGKPEHLMLPGDIPVVQTERGGQVTYHGPGQLVAYLLLDVRRLGIGVRELVSRIEASLVALLASYQVTAAAKPDAPGVYVDNAKIASLGLRIRNGCAFHGLALNVDMDLAPFRRIRSEERRTTQARSNSTRSGRGCANSWSGTSTTLSRRPSRAESTEYDYCARSRAESDRDARRHAPPCAQESRGWGQAARRREGGTHPGENHPHRRAAEETRLDSRAHPGVSGSRPHQATAAQAQAAQRL